MSERRMPTTLPSPVDRGRFRFVAADASGTVWWWVDKEMVWVPAADGAPSDADDAGSLVTVHLSNRQAARRRKAREELAAAVEDLFDALAQQRPEFAVYVEVAAEVEQRSLADAADSGGGEPSQDRRINLWHYICFRRTTYGN